jgi:hypothetical protein
MLAKLPRLAMLGLQDASAPDLLPPAPPMHVRPTLPALTCVSVDDGSMAALHVLARWTRVAEAGVELDAEDAFLTCTLQVKGWSTGWLRAAIALDQRITEEEAAKSYHPSGYALGDDGDVARFNAAMTVDPFPFTVLLGQDVTPAGCLALKVGSELWLNSLHAEGLQPHVLGWPGPLQPTAEHLVALTRPCLTVLVVDDAGLLTDKGVRSLVSKAAGLVELRLRNAAQVTDAALWAVCAACRQLQRLVLRGAGKVTAAGLLPLLTTHRALQCLGLERGAGQESADLPVLLSSLEAAFPGMHQAWHVLQGASTSYDLAFRRRTGRSPSPSPSTSSEE